MAGLSEKLTAHPFRRGFAVDVLEGWANLREVQDLLGHKSITATQIYTRLTNKSLERAYLKRASFQE